MVETVVKLSKNHFIKKPREIIQKIFRYYKGKKKTAKIQGIDFICCPNVYPSDQFRTTDFLLTSIKPILRGKVICDMGCGPGIIGLYAFYNEAKKIIQVDISQYAVENAEINRKYHGIPKKIMPIYQSNCFDFISKQSFDLIIFNPPFHSDAIVIKDPIEYAFFDPNFETIQKFLAQASNYAHKQTEIIVAFSNKGDVKKLEGYFDKYGYHWTLWKLINQDQMYDNRIYLLKASSASQKWL